MKDDLPLTEAQHALGDMEIEEFRSAAHEVADRVADYLKGLESYRILPAVEPGEIRDQLPGTPPADPVGPFVGATEPLPSWGFVDIPVPLYDGIRYTLIEVSTDGRRRRVKPVLAFTASGELPEKLEIRVVPEK